MLNRIKAFRRGCFDFVTRVKLTDSGYVVYNGQLLTLSPRAKQQLCRIVGCTPTFLDLLSDEGYASVCNAFLEEDLLVRCRDTEVRAILPLSRTWVNYESVVMACSCLGMKLVYLGDDFMILEGIGNPCLLVLSSEVGYCSTCSLLKFKLLSGCVLKKVRVSCMNVDKLSQVLDSFKSKLVVLKDSLHTIVVKLRKIDLRVLPYTLKVKQRLVGYVESETKISYRELVSNAGSLNSVRDRLTVQCDLFDVGVTPSKYIRDGCLIKWPMRANWLRG